MTHLVVPLGAPAARLPNLAGGKGAALARMLAAGLPVPAGFVITTAAFRRGFSGLPGDLAARLDATAAGELGSLGDLCESARHAVLDRAVPAEVADAIARAYGVLGTDAPVAVRSSGTFEDQPSASFAGQHDTFLNVVGIDALVDGVRGVWASLFSTRAVAYRARLGIPHGAALMAVVVQRQVAPDAAGVLFTRDPMTGAEGRFVVNATLGLGEGVVSGGIPSDTFELDGETFAVAASWVVPKGRMVTPAAGGGVMEVAVPGGRRRAPALSGDELAELGRLAARVRSLFGTHQDIEFAVEGGAVVLLQARPVTGLERDAAFPVAWDDPADEERGWSRSEGPLYRLEEDAVRAYWDGARVCFEETGSAAARNHVVRFLNGYSYTRAPETDEGEVAARRERHRQRDLACIARGTTLYDAEIEPEAKQALRGLEAFSPATASLSDLVAHLEGALDAYRRVIGDLHWRMTAGVRTDWPAVFAEITGEPEVASGVLLQAIPHATTRLVRRLQSMARLVQTDDVLSAIFRDREYGRLEEADLRSRAAVRRLRGRLRGLLRDYGHRTGSGYGSAAGFATPTWNMEPSRALDVVRSYAAQDLEELGRRDGHARRARRRMARRIRQRLASDSERLARLEEELAVAVAAVRRMEDHNHWMEQGVTGALREAVHYLGSGLVRRGLLDGADEALHLSLAELRAIAGGGAADVRGLVRERAAEFEAHKRMRAPAALGRGKPSPEDDARYEAPGHVGLEGTVVRGVGASPGRARGRARVAPTGAEPPHVERGDILVARNAGPAWTPVFPLLGGLVLDGGAVFQHAALVCREYGIPAIVMARDATRVVLDGQMVVLDADRGILDLAPR